MHKKITGKIAAVKKGFQGEPAAIPQNRNGRYIKNDLQQYAAEFAGQTLDFGIQRIRPDGSEPVFETIRTGERILHLANRAVKTSLNHGFGDFGPML